MGAKLTTTFIHSGLIVALAVLCAHWFWVFAAPRQAAVGSTAAATGTPVIATVQRAHLFGTAASAAITPEQASDLRLQGAFASAQGGVALIAINTGRAQAVRTGDEIAKGITLLSVGTDHVRIRRDGVEQRLELAPRSVPAAATAAPVAAPLSPASSSPGPVTR